MTTIKMLVYNASAWIFTPAPGYLRQRLDIYARYRPWPYSNQSTT
ncbi:hypothetical protein ACF5F8_003989 [Salmonella enterica]